MERDREREQQEAIQRFQRGDRPVTIYRALGRSKPWFFRRLHRYREGIFLLTLKPRRVRTRFLQQLFRRSASQNRAMAMANLSLTELIDIIESIPGWLRSDEAYMLYELARDWPGAGRTVELGSAQGRSTVCLALALRARNKGDLPVVAVDTHRGSREHQPGMPYFDSETFDPASGRVDTFPAFLNNIALCGLSEYVEPWRCTTKEAALRFHGSVRLLFVDADHEEESVRADIEVWSPHMERTGLVVLHDVGEWPGPTRLAEELMTHEGFALVRQSSSALALAVPRMRCD